MFTNTCCLRKGFCKMSFKRDGNDSGLLKNLQHRRVAEMLGDHIPDDEAVLLSNGRLTCTVCSKRPIFDTMQMLSLHRKGKKHVLELSRYLQHKRDLEYKKQKQTQRSFLRTEQISIIEPDTNSIVNRNKRKISGTLSNRKLVLDITESCDRIKSNLNASAVVEPSANSQVRRYLKSLSRKRPLEKTINKLRENYGARMSQSKTDTQTKIETEKREEKPTNSRSEDRQQSNQRIKLLESGWIQDSNGKWMKDPNVEFDSDEDEPPTIP